MSHPFRRQLHSYVSLRQCPNPTLLHEAKLFRRPTSSATYLMLVKVGQRAKCLMAGSTVTPRETLPYCLTPTTRRHAPILQHVVTAPESSSAPAYLKV